SSATSFFKSRVRRLTAARDTSLPQLFIPSETAGGQSLVSPVYSTLSSGLLPTPHIPASPLSPSALKRVRCALPYSGKGDATDDWEEDLKHVMLESPYGVFGPRADDDGEGDDDTNSTPSNDSPVSELSGTDGDTESLSQIHKEQHAEARRQMEAVVVAMRRE